MPIFSEALPLADRLTVWQLVKAERDGDILLEVSDAVRESLIADMDDHEILAAARGRWMRTMATADLAPELPRDVVLELMESLLDTAQHHDGCGQRCPARMTRSAR